jgi:hypothetical protein
MSNDVVYVDEETLHTYAAGNPNHARCRRLGHFWLEAEDVVSMRRSLPPDFLKALGLRSRGKNHGGGFEETLGCGRCFTTKTHVLDSRYRRVDEHPDYEWPEGYAMKRGAGIIGRHERDILREAHYKALKGAKRKGTLRVVKQPA